jgi:hypothetical protein
MSDAPHVGCSFLPRAPCPGSRHPSPLLALALGLPPCGGWGCVLESGGRRPEAWPRFLVPPPPLAPRWRSSLVPWPSVSLPPSRLPRPLRDTARWGLGSRRGGEGETQLPQWKERGVTRVFPVSPEEVRLTLSLLLSLVARAHCQGRLRRCRAHHDISGHGIRQHRELGSAFQELEL